MSKNKVIKQRNPVACAMCTSKQFQNKVIPNKKKKIKKFDYRKEMQNYKGHDRGLFRIFVI